MESLNVNGRLFCRLLLAVALMLSSLLFLVAHSQADTFFGPEVFTRDSGKPVTVMQQIPTDGFQSPFILHLQNGDENGEHRVSSAKVLLNGAVLFGPSDFSQQVSGHDIQVKLENPSTLEVRLASSPGSMLTIWIEGTPTINPNARIVGPEGGRFEFPNGIILDMPPGAVTETTALTVTNLPCAGVNVMLSAPQYASHEKRCLRGFSAKPDLAFNVPIKASVPVSLEPGEIPVQLEVDVNEQKYRITGANLVYRGAEGVVEMNLEHFSDYWVAALENNLDESCKRWETYQGVADICETWDERQPGCCMLLQSERTAHVPDCVCCRELLMEVEYSGINFASGDCEIAGDDVKVTFPFCDGSPTETYSVGEISPECPDMDFEINVTPPVVDLLACEASNLKATITGRSADGSVVLKPSPFFPKWRSLNETVAVVSQDGKVEGKEEGTTGVLALVSEVSTIPPGQALVNVTSNISSFMVDPPHLELKSNEVGILGAIALDRFGDPLDASTVRWWSANPAVADATLASGPVTFVTALNKGSTPVMAEYTYECEKKRAMADVTVECMPIKFTIDPLQPKIPVLDGRILDAKLFDDQDNPLDASEVTWTSSDENTAYVTQTTGEWTSVEGLQGGTVTITATYNDGCQTKEAEAQITVCETSFTVDPANVTIVPSGQRALDAIVLDRFGIPLDASAVTWSSGSPAIANVLMGTGKQTTVVGMAPSTVPVPITATYDDGCETKEATALVTVECSDLAVIPNIGVVKVNESLPLSLKAVDSQGNPLDVALPGITWRSSDENTATVNPSVGPKTVAVGIEAGIAEITAFSDQGVCGIETATSMISVCDDCPDSYYYCNQPYNVYDERTDSTLRIVYEDSSGRQEILAEHNLWPAFQDGVFELEGLDSGCDANGILHVVYALEYWSVDADLETWHMYGVCETCRSSELLEGVEGTELSLTFDSEKNLELVYAKSCGELCWNIMYFNRSTSEEVTLVTIPGEYICYPEGCRYYPELEDIESEREADGRLHVVYGLWYGLEVQTYDIYH